MTTFYDLPQPSEKAFKRSQALSQSIQQTIDAAGGVISFANFMALALYHPPLGYYHAQDFTIGKQGDFTTASEISPLYANCFARQCEQILMQLGESDLLELGAGTGTFALALLGFLAARGVAPAHYYIYEVSESLRQQQQIRLSTIRGTQIIWLDQLPDAFTGIIIANEVLDALPIHCFQIEEQQILERGVTGKNNIFSWQTGSPFSAGLIEAVTHIRDEHHLTAGYQSEINLQLSDFIKSLSDCLTRGVILLADYGYGQTEYYHPERRNGSLTCFYQHRHHNHPFFFPGLQDITAHVDFTAVAEAASTNGCELSGYTTQAAFLLSCGLMTLAAEEEKQLNPRDAFMFHQAIKTLTLPTEMGERVKIMAITKNYPDPLLGFSMQDRKRTL